VINLSKCVQRATKNLIKIYNELIQVFPGILKRVVSKNQLPIQKFMGLDVVQSF
jgi:hypothetical protein